jgi:hypothetical protein
MRTSNQLVRVSGLLLPGHGESSRFLDTQTCLLSRGRADHAELFKREMRSTVSSVADSRKEGWVSVSTGSDRWLGFGIWVVWACLRTPFQAENSGSWNLRFKLLKGEEHFSIP